MTLVDAETGELVDVLDEAGARELTERIRSTVEEGWRLLAEAHDRRAWRAMGYDSFAAYLSAEFDMGRAHAYRLIDQARVIRELTAAAGLSPMGDTVELSEREARDLKPVLPDVVEKVAEATADLPADDLAARREAAEEVARQERERQQAAADEVFGDSPETQAAIEAQAAFKKRRAIRTAFEAVKPLAPSLSVEDLDAIARTGEDITRWARTVKQGRRPVVTNMKGRR